MKASFVGRRVGNQLAAALVVALALLFVLTSCSSSADPLFIDASDLQVVEVGDVTGQWIWLRSTGGIAGTTRTPETEGYEASIRFGVDGTVEWRQDGELQWSTTWVLVDLTAGPLPGQKTIQYGDPVFGWDEQGVGLSRDGHLVLTDPCCDGFQREFVRNDP
jgi:hypothetical protein